MDWLWRSMFQALHGKNKTKEGYAIQEQHRLTIDLQVISLGHDGSNSGFYKASWDLIGSLVCSAIQEAKPTSLKIFMKAFKEFTSYSCLKANLAKSQIVFGGNCTQLQQDCLEITGFSEGHIPFRYLGMPITASKLSKLECRTLVEQISGKITA
ncbi:hypothetical protein Cgig2_011573 [Carnegiea gigantea]|uniref:Reverse transcriptase n=1 Tax=Carnegiea gigantea TaxID=171969 RepID=A0A9Q1GIN9_9CARY|nr:hypothetical protein Cgig2_011573 [Carnegiea gigantea]